MHALLARGSFLADYESRYIRSLIPASVANCEQRRDLLMEDPEHQAFRSHIDLEYQDAKVGPFWQMTSL